jgi:hypothetical protein
MVILTGIVFNLAYIVGAIFPDATMLSILPWVALLFLYVTSTHIHIRTAHILAIICIVAIYEIGYARSDSNEYANYKAIMFAFKFIPFLLLPLILKENIGKFFIGYAIPLFVFICFALFESIGLFNYVSVNDRLDVGVFSSIWVSRVALELVLLGFLVFRIRLRYLILLSAIIFPVLYTSGSKGPIFSFVLAVMVWYLIERCSTAKQRFWSLFVIFLTYFVAVESLSVIDVDSYFYQRFLLQVPDGSEAYEYSRAVLWPIAFENILAQNLFSLLFGNGIGGYEGFIFGTSSGDRYYAHNIFMELIIENGLIVTIIFAISLIRIFSLNPCCYRYLLLYALANAQVSGDILLNEHVLFYAAVTWAYGKRHQGLRTRPST